MMKLGIMAMARTGPVLRWIAMQTDYLRYFIDVVTLGSMSSAAKKNYMTPPPESQRGQHAPVSDYSFGEAKPVYTPSMQEGE